MKNFKYEAKLKEFCSKHLPTHHLESVVNLLLHSVSLSLNPGQRGLWLVVSELTVNSPRENKSTTVVMRQGWSSLPG